MDASTGDDHIALRDVLHRGAAYEANVFDRLFCHTRRKQTLNR